MRARACIVAVTIRKHVFAKALMKNREVSLFKLFVVVFSF